MKSVKAIVIAHNQYRQVQVELDCLQEWNGIAKKDIIIVDNASSDELTEWLRQQSDYDYIICDEGVEPFPNILNTVMDEYVEGEDVLLLNPDYLVMPDAVSISEQVLNESRDYIGAVCPFVIEHGKTGRGESIEQAVAYAEQVKSTDRFDEKISVQADCCLIANRFLRTIGRLDEHLVRPDNAMTDLSFRGLKEGFRYAELEAACVWQISMSDSPYDRAYKCDVDRPRMKEKWAMNYFNELPNDHLLTLIHHAPADSFRVLEIGCDCGVNLLWVKNRYPNAALYGVEINPQAADIASHYADVQVGNIESDSIKWEQTKFDYIVFGDVLEHLRDPEAVIKTCRRYLADDGRILACIPNLMHYSVIRELLNGDFTYTDRGLLDRTHIHFFTYNEISRMFSRQGYKSRVVSFTITPMSVEDESFIEKLMQLTNNAEPYMFQAFQYIVEAACENETEENNMTKQNLWVINRKFDNLKYEVCTPEEGRSKGFFMPQFRSNEETIRLIIQEKKSLARFGDGEFSIVANIPRQKYQRLDRCLADRIKQVLLAEDDRLLIAIADNYGNLSQYNDQAADGIRFYMDEDTRKLHESLLKRDRIYSDTYITRPYVIYRDNMTDAPKKRFNALKGIWKGKRIVIVEGSQSRLGVGNDLFDEATSVRRILAPPTSSFDRYEDLLKESLQVTDVDLFLLAIGPSSGVLAYDLTINGFQAVDVGHIDMEYEWFQAGKGCRIPVPGKYNNEVIGGDIVAEVTDEKYLSQIIADYSER